MHVPVLASNRPTVPLWRRVGAVGHVYAEGEAASGWLAERGWHVEPIESPLRVVADELVTPDGVLRRVWHSGAAVRSERTSADRFAPTRVRLLLVLQGSLNGIQPPGLMLARVDRPLAFETPTAAAWAEMLVGNADHEWMADGDGIHVDRGTARPTAAWATLTSMLITLLNSEEPTDEPVLALMRQATEHAAAALLVERRLSNSGGGGGDSSARERLVDQADALIREYATDPDFTVEALARRMNLSRRYVSKLLSETGDTPQRRIRRERLRVATRLLSGRDPAVAASIEEAARLSGFPSPRALREALRESNTS